jgi:hypothetical protein
VRVARRVLISVHVSVRTRDDGTAARTHMLSEQLTRLSPLATTRTIRVMLRAMCRAGIGFSTR